MQLKAKFLFFWDVKKSLSSWPKKLLPVECVGTPGKQSICRVWPIQEFIEFLTKIILHKIPSSQTLTEMWDPLPVLEDMRTNWETMVETIIKHRCSNPWSLYRNKNIKSTKILEMFKNVLKYWNPRFFYPHRKNCKAVLIKKIEFDRNGKVRNWFFLLIT